MNGCQPTPATVAKGPMSTYNQCFLNCPSERVLPATNSMRVSAGTIPQFVPVAPGDNYRMTATSSRPTMAWCTSPLTHGWRGDM